ncbi:MAG: hypothetical protein IPL73_11160 [Candidatus Obscuribacter sp.]|nr:hypothetical protein [Candidatus Obscuribacter sp.]
MGEKERYDLGALLTDDERYECERVSQQDQDGIERMTNNELDLYQKLNNDEQWDYRRMTQRNARV